MRKPSYNPVTLPFGATTAPYSPSKPHTGVDMGHSPDRGIYAPFSGPVTVKPNNGNDGNAIYMWNGPTQMHGLLHISEFLVQNGTYVEEGQKIAIMGETGYAFGVHLHWAVKQDGKFINPLSLVKEEDMQKINKQLINVLSDTLRYRPGTGADPAFLQSWLGKDLSVENLIKMLVEFQKSGEFKDTQAQLGNEANKKLEQIKKIVS